MYTQVILYRPAILRLRIGQSSQFYISGAVIRTQNAQRICLRLEGLERLLSYQSAKGGRRQAWVGGQKGIRWSLNPTTLKLDGTLRRTSSTPVTPR